MTNTDHGRSSTSPGSRLVHYAALADQQRCLRAPLTSGLEQLSDSQREHGDIVLFQVKLLGRACNTHRTWHPVSCAGSQVATWTEVPAVINVEKGVASIKLLRLTTYVVCNRETDEDVPSEIATPDSEVTEDTGISDKKITVSLAIGLPMASSEFDDATQATFKMSVAAAAKADRSAVVITGIEDTSRRVNMLRRLLAGIKVDVAVEAASKEGASAMAGELTIDSINSELESAGLPSAVLLEEPMILDPSSNNSSPAFGWQSPNYEAVGALDYDDTEGVHHLQTVIPVVVFAVCLLCSVALISSVIVKKHRQARKQKMQHYLDLQLKVWTEGAAVSTPHSKSSIGPSTQAPLVSDGIPLGGDCSDRERTDSARSSRSSLSALSARIEVSGRDTSRPLPTLLNFLEVTPQVAWGGFPTFNPTSTTEEVLPASRNESAIEIKVFHRPRATSGPRMRVSVTEDGPKSSITAAESRPCPQEDSSSEETQTELELEDTEMRSEESSRSAYKVMETPASRDFDNDRLHFNLTQHHASSGIEITESPRAGLSIANLIKEVNVNTSRASETVSPAEAARYTLLHGQAAGMKASGDTSDREIRDEAPRRRTALVLPNLTVFSAPSHVQTERTCDVDEHVDVKSPLSHDVDVESGGEKTLKSDEIFTEMPGQHHDIQHSREAALEQNHLDGEDQVVSSFMFSTDGDPEEEDPGQEDVEMHLFRI